MVRHYKTRLAHHTLRASHSPLTENELAEEATAATKLQRACAAHLADLHDGASPPINVRPGADDARPMRLGRVLTHSPCSSALADFG